MNQKNLLRKYLPEYTSYRMITQKILRENPETRADDRLLIRKVTEYCFKNEIKQPSYETITRCRRALNSEGLYLPDKETLEKRKGKQQFFERAGKEGLL